MSETELTGDVNADIVKALREDSAKKDEEIVALRESLQVFWKERDEANTRADELEKKIKVLEAQTAPRTGYVVAMERARRLEDTIVYMKQEQRELKKSEELLHKLVEEARSELVVAQNRIKVLETAWEKTLSDGRALFEHE
jgi:chromosome segregation ATPase